jgi:serine/threonine protein kinase/tetratricopeptide (TPR) repeat protein
MDCPDIMDLEGYVLGDGDESARVSIGAHVLQCSTCAQEVAELGENLKMASALRRDAGTSPNDDEPPQMMSSSAPSELIGPYRIIRALGQGGMGTVYEAQQENPRRVVALKMMRPGLVSRSLLSRFRHEAQILGRLKHPGIAQIYEAGTHQHNGQPQPYFVMELVRGQSLVKYAVAKKLGRRERMELMARICDAVHHAHQQGVIHRDLKPDNILIDESQPDSLQPKILDFGVARIIDPESQTQTLHTSAGQIVGTVAYMSPEQANADPTSIDTRSDVYALGVICYQLVSGQLPYRLNTASVAESVRAIVQDEPTPLSTVDRSLRGDVTTIVGKALEKDKTRRYQSAAEMAADIRRHLRDEPITAVPPSTIYQVRKFARRNKGLVVGIALAFVLLIAGVIGTSVGLVRAKRALVKADRSAAEARSEADKQAAVNNFLQDMLGAANPRNLTAEDRAKGRNISVLDALNFAAKKVDAGSLKDHPDVELAVRKSMAVAYSEIADSDTADHHLQAALELSRRLYGANSGETGDVLNTLALLRKQQGKYADGADLALQAVEMTRDSLGENNASFATCVDTLGAMRQAQGKYPEAEALYRQAFALRRKLFGDESREAASSLNNLAFVLDEQSRESEAEPLYRQSLAIRRRVLGDHPDTATAINNLGFVVRAKGQMAEAEALFRESLAMRRRTLGEHPSTATGINNLASVLQAEHKLDECESLYKEALAMDRKFNGPEHPMVAHVLNNLASLRVGENKFAEAEPDFRESLAIRRKAYSDPHPAIAIALRNLASTLVELDRSDEAEPLLLESIAMNAKLKSPPHETAHAQAILGAAHVKLKRYDEAERELLAALKVLGPRISPDDPRGSAVLKSLVRLYKVTDRPEQAAVYAKLHATSKPVTTMPTTTPALPG